MNSPVAEAIRRLPPSSFSPSSRASWARVPLVHSNDTEPMASRGRDGSASIASLELKSSSVVPTEHLGAIRARTWSPLLLDLCGCARADALAKTTRAQAANNRAYVGCIGLMRSRVEAAMEGSGYGGKVLDGRQPSLLYGRTPSINRRANLRNARLRAGGSVICSTGPKSSSSPSHATASSPRLESRSSYRPRAVCRVGLRQDWKT